MSILINSRLGRYGRFANGAFSAAGTIGIARKVGADFAFPLWRNYDGLNFESDIDIDVYRRFVNPLPLYDGPDLPTYGVPWGYHDVRPSGSWDMHGHFQSEQYFAHCLDEVRWYMRMLDEPEQNDYCAIHWRAGDYGPAASPQHPDGNDYHPRMSLDYYEPAMRLFGSQQKFLVFSDSIDEARQMFGDRVEYAHGSYLDDFRLMKTCRHFIVANSSFSAFAAILGDADDKQVVAPEPWFGGGYSTISGEDIYSPGWNVVNYQTGRVRVK